MSIDIEKKLADSIAEVTGLIGREMVARGHRAANELRNAELQVLRGQRSGKVYRKPHSRATYRASAPGEPPARRSGNLRNNWSEDVTVENVGKITSVKSSIKSGADYSGILQNGSQRMAPRPYVELIEEKAEPRISRIYNETYIQ